MKRLLVACLVGLAATSQAQETRPLSAAVLWQLSRLGAPAISADDRHIVAPVTRYDLETDKPATRLWLFSTDGSTERPLTAEGLTAEEPVFSPDGDTLAFLRRESEDEPKQIWLLPMDRPGEARQLTDLPTGASGLKWVGEHIYFLSNIWPDRSFAEMKETIEAEKEDHVSAHLWNALPYAFWDHWIDEDRNWHVFRVSPENGEIEGITQPLGWPLPDTDPEARSYDVSPDEAQVAFVADSRRDAVSPDNDVFLASIGGEEARNLTAENRGSDTAPMFSPDGRFLAWLQRSTPGFYGDQSELILLELPDGARRNLTADWDRSASGLVWLPDGSGFYGAIDDAGSRRVYHLGLDGSRRRITEGSDFAELAISEKSTLVGTNESFLHPRQLVRVDPATGAVERLDTLNDDVLADVELGSYESATYTGYGGARIQMWINYPPGFDPSRRYPLILLIHGGPHNAITDSFHFRWNAQTFASWGYVTAWPNFHGSSGFGQEFTDAINPDWLTAPYADTVAAAEWLAAKEWIDDERMVAAGGSYGGYLTSILLGKPHPFQALMIHAPVYDMYAQMAADFAVHTERFGPYWEKPEIYERISPHYYAGEFDTPALIIHGQKDLRVPVGQAFELFRTLETRGIESRLIYFPDENHWILKPNNSIYWYDQVRRWMARFAEPGPAARH